MNRQDAFAQRLPLGEERQELSFSIDLPFFYQDVERWILTTRTGLDRSSDTASLRKLADLIELGDELQIHLRPSASICGFITLEY